MAQINDLYYEDLTPQRMAEIIDRLRAGEEVSPGSQTWRLASAPDGGPQTLLNVPERPQPTSPCPGPVGHDSMLQLPLSFLTTVTSSSPSPTPFSSFRFFSPFFFLPFFS